MKLVNFVICTVSVCINKSYINQHQGWIQDFGRQDMPRAWGQGQSPKKIGNGDKIPEKLPAGDLLQVILLYSDVLRKQNNILST